MMMTTTRIPAIPDHADTADPSRDRGVSHGVGRTAAKSGQKRCAVSNGGRHRSNGGQNRRRRGPDHHVPLFDHLARARSVISV